MFYASPVLYKRTAVRLKGFKPPAVKLLKETMDFVHQSTMAQKMPTPHWEPESGLSNHQAWEKLSMPLLAIHQKAGLEVDFQGQGSGHQTENERLALIHEQFPKQKIWSEREDQLVDDAKAVAARAADLPQIVLRKQRRREGSDYIPGRELLQTKAGAKVNPPRYKPPATLYWKHSVYSYNKNTTIPLPITGQTSSKILRAFFNRVPSDAGVESVLPQLKTAESRHTSVLRAYLSEKSTPKTNLHPSLLGKLSTRGKQEFYHPWKKIREALPEVTYKHYPGGEVGIQAFVYDRRLEALKQKREKVAREILGMVVAGKLIPNSETETEFLKAVGERV